MADDGANATHVISAINKRCTSHARAPPLPPDEFARVLDGKSFTSKKVSHIHHLTLTLTLILTPTLTLTLILTLILILTLTSTLTSTLTLPP